MKETLTIRLVMAVLVIVGWTSAATAQTSLQPTLEQLRPQYPTPMSPAQLAELLDRTAWIHRAEGWGLLRKDTGNRCPLSNGVPISCDFLFHLPSKTGFEGRLRSDTRRDPCRARPGGPVDRGVALGCTNPTAAGLGGQLVCVGLTRGDCE